LLSAALALAVVAGALFAVQVERERNAHAAQSVAEAAALYPKAVWFRDQSESLPVGFLPTWAEALGHVRRTAEVIRDGAVDEQLRIDVAEVVRSIEQQERELQRRIRSDKEQSRP
jgi:hypothetical protein